MMPRCPLHWVLVLVTLGVIATLYMFHYPNSQPRYYLPYTTSEIKTAIEGSSPKPLLDDIFNATLGVSAPDITCVIRLILTQLDAAVRKDLRG